MILRNIFAPLLHLVSVRMSAIPSGGHASIMRAIRTVILRASVSNIGFSGFGASSFSCTSPHSGQCGTAEDKRARLLISSPCLLINSSNNSYENVLSSSERVSLYVLKKGNSNRRHSIKILKSSTRAPPNRDMKTLYQRIWQITSIFQNDFSGKALVAVWFNRCNPVHFRQKTAPFGGVTHCQTARLMV